MATHYDVFLSHSSADKPAVEELARKLLAAGLTPFLDKWHLVAGEPWQEALEEALDQSRTCAVFVGPKGIGPWQNEEMRSALEERVKDKSRRVIPVLLPGSLESHKKKLPRFLRRLTWVDLHGDLGDEEVFGRLVSGIKGEAPGPGGSGGVGLQKRDYRCMAQAPTGFVHRSQYEEVLDLLCPKEGEDQPNSVALATALRGAGGFGKTTLAQAICFDDRVRQTYPDGILWTTMGEDLDSNGRLARIRDLIRWQTEEKEAPTFETAAAAGARLRELLANSRALVVLDDVWSSADVTPFQGLPTGSALLITTRNRQTLPTDSRRIDVDAMASSEAIELLRAGLPGGSSKNLQSLVALLGEWPLLLTLVNGQLRKLVNEGGLTVLEAVQEAAEALDSVGFSAFDQNDPDSRHAAASKAILVSVCQLQEVEQDLYFQLSIFPEDVDIPLSVLEQYWGLARVPARRFCEQLQDRSLLQQFNRKEGTIRLHDVVRKVLIEHIGNRITTLHCHLRDVFRPSSGSWTDLPVEEQYLWRNMAGHYIGANRKEELSRLLTDFFFLQAKLNATDVNSLMADYESFVSEDRELQLIRDTLRLSAHVLARDRRQLASQLFGRLTGLSGKSIEHLVSLAGTQLQLRPRKANLAQPGGPLLRILQGHLGGVSALALVDSHRAVSGSTDGTLRVWDLETGETLRTFEGHSRVVNTVAVVDGCRVVSGSDDKTLRVWDLETGEILRIFKGHWLGVTAVAVVDGHRVISGSSDRTLQVWNLETGEDRRIFGGDSGVTAVAVVDSRRAISGSSDKSLRVWDLKTGETLRTLHGHLRKVAAVAVVDGRRAVSGSSDGILRVWDLETGETLRVFRGHSDWVTAVAVVDGRRAVSGSSDGVLWVWDMETGETLRALESHSRGLTTVAVVDGRRVVSGSDDGSLRVWDLETGESLRTLEGYSGGVRAVLVAEGHRVVSGSYDGALRVWDWETGETLRTLEGHSNGLRALAMVDGRQAVSGSSDGRLRVWDLETGEILRKLEGQARVTVLTVVGCWAISGSSDGMLRVWDLETGETLRTLEGHLGGIYAVAVVDGRRVVSGSYDGVLRVWDLETGKTLRKLEGHSGGIYAIAVVDGRRAVSGSSDGRLRVWDLETGEILRTLEGHSDRVNAVALVDSRRVLSGSEDRTLQVRDLETGETLAVMTLDTPILSVAVILDGRIVVAGDEIGRVHFLDLILPPAD